MNDPTLLPIADRAEVWAAVRGLARRRLFRLASTQAVLIVAAVVALFAPLLLGRMVDIVVEGRPTGDLVMPTIGLLAVALGGGLLTMLGGILVAVNGEAMLADLREDVMRHALALPLDRIERAGSGDLLSRVSQDVTRIAEAVRHAFPEFASAALTVALTVVGLAVLDWRLALAGLCAAPIHVFAVRWYLRRSGPKYREERVNNAQRSHVLLDAIDGAATVRAFGLQSLHHRSVVERSNTAMATTFSATRMAAWFFSQLNAAEFVGLSMILAVGFLLVRSGEVTIGATTAAALYFQRAFDPINSLLALLDDAQSAAASLARLVGVINAPREVEPLAPAHPADASVDLHGVHFAYRAGHDVLDGVTIRIEPAEHVALVGASGAGKSTVAKIVAGIHPPQQGEVHLGGVRLRELGTEVVRRNVGLVSQEVHLFSGTLANDLRLAKPQATDEELIAVLEQVGAGSWFATLGAGLETLIGDGALRLTTTQAQQVALGRLILAGRPVVILDEATAEAGSAGARSLESAARVAMSGRTAILVAHRLSQAATCDRVIVLEAGRVVEQGPHEELAAAEGPYSKLWQAWSNLRT